MNMIWICLKNIYKNISSLFISDQDRFYERVYAYWKLKSELEFP